MKINEVFIMYEYEVCGRKWTVDKVAGDRVRTCKSKYGTYTVIDACKSCESYKMTYIPKKKAYWNTVTKKSWEFIPDGKSSFFGSYEWLTDVEYAIESFEFRLKRKEEEMTK